MMAKDSRYTRVRRSRRIDREIPIEVSGLDLWGRNFTASTRTLVVSRYGAKIYLEQELAPEQEITVSRLEIGRDRDARVVALVTKESRGHTYGIEFLDQSIDFWGIRFPAALEPEGWALEAETTSGSSDATVETEQEPLPRRNLTLVSAPPDLAHTGDLRNAAVKAFPGFGDVLPAAPDGLKRTEGTKNYRLRFNCQYGDGAQWVVLSGRKESLQEMLGTHWEFECPTHGVQHALPLEVMEDCADLQPAGATGMQAGSQPERRRQQEVRIAKRLRVWVRGMDRNGEPFSQSSYSVNISRHGARLDGTGLLTRAGEIVEVRRGWRKATFRVVWSGQVGTPQANQVGLRCLEPRKNIWRIS